MTAPAKGPLGVGSLFSGVGGFDIGLERAGHEIAWHSEIEPHACAVLRERWPDVPNLGDVTKIDGAAIPPVDVICGGFPCQDLSVAGKRRGFEGERSVLAFEFLRIVREMREATDGAAPTFLVLENVPGLFTSAGGRDFGALLDALGDLRPMDVAWRVLDSRYFGVAQRRRRVFVVVDFGGERCDEVLALTEGLRWNPPAGRAAREDVAGTLGGGSSKRGWSDDLDRNGAFVAGTVSSKRAKGTGGPAGDECYNLVSHSLRADGFDASEDGTGRGIPLVADPISAHEQSTYTHEGKGNFRLRNVVIPFDERNVTSPDNRSRCEPGEPCHTLHEGAPAVAIRTAQTSANGHGIAEEAVHTLDRASGQAVVSSGVRRLTPRECERLQGFPETAKSAIIAVCGEKQKSDAGAVLQSLRSRRNASPVEESALRRFAPFVELQSASRRPDLAIPADVSVLIDSERGGMLIHSHGRSLWSASDADDRSWSRLHMRGAAFVRLAADTMQCLEQATPCGEEDSPPSSVPSVVRSHGSVCAVLSGREIDDAAAAVGQSTTTESEPSTSTTSRATGSSRPYNSRWQTSCSSVVRAIASFIPEPTWRESGFVLRLTVVSPWTRYGRKPDGTRYELADGPRYKCMGNAVTVSVAEWIGKQLAVAICGAGGWR